MVVPALTATRGALLGAQRGVAAAFGYAGFLPTATILADAYSTQITHTTYGGGFDAGSVVVFLILAGYVAVLAGIVGLVGGAVAGAALVLVVNRSHRSTRALALGSGIVALVVGAALFPWVPLGEGTTGIYELVTLKLVPAALGGGAAAWHVSSLRRELGDARERSREERIDPGGDWVHHRA